MSAALRDATRVDWPRAGTPEAYEQAYQAVAADPDALPWGGAPCPALVEWLCTRAHGLVRAGARVAVAGCGTGEDAVELERRGYDVTAFDISAIAIELAACRAPDAETRFIQADLLHPPTRMLRRFDLVVSVDVLCALAPSPRRAAAQGLASLAAPHGAVLCIERAEGARSGPPWGLDAEHLGELFREAGLVPQGAVETVEDTCVRRTTRRVRGVFARP